MAITKVYLMQVPLENDYKHTLYFENISAQHNYFESKIQNSYTDFTYQRKDEKIRIPAHYDSIVNCNYLMYQNTTYNSKWFYAFITDKKYISDGLTEIYIETDVMQTWYFDYVYKQCFIEREHTANDAVGANTVPEGLETGEYICNDLERDMDLREYAYILCATENVANPENKDFGTNFGGVWSAGGAWVSDNATNLIALIREYDLAGISDAITNFYMVPKIIVEDTDSTLHYSGQSSPKIYTKSFAKQTTLNGYTPKNKKLLTYPYNYLLLSNNSGASNVIQYELFSGSNCEFEIEGVATPGGSIKCVPMNYKGLNRIQEEGIMLGKFPVLSWSADLYTNWLTQNSLNNTVGFATDALKIVGGVATAVTTGGIAGTAGGGLAISGVNGIVNRLLSIHEHSFTPSSARGNTNGGDINTAYNMNTFYFYKMSIKAEYARIIDDFFTMYGYKTHRVKTPNYNHRQKFWYTKTIDCELDGAMPQNDLNKIKSIYNNGVTYWRNASEIANYSLSNPVI